MSKNTTPLEDYEQIAFVQWLVVQQLKHTAVPNSTYTKSWKQKLHNKRMGLNAGLPDLLVIVPAHRSKDGLGYLLFIEMKRVKGGVVSKEQQGWIDALNALGTLQVVAEVAKGAEQAVRIVTHYLKAPRKKDIF